jgi:hypothetical protein
MPIDTRGYKPSREGSKSKVLQEIIQYLDGRIGESLKNGGAVHLDIKSEDEEGEGDPVSPDALEDPLAASEDDDEEKLLALARKRR